MEKPIAERRLKGLTVQGLTGDYKDIMMWGPSFNLEHIQSSMEHLILDTLAGRNANDGKIAGGGADMTTEPKSGPDQVVCR